MTVSHVDAGRDRREERPLGPVESALSRLRLIIAASLLIPILARTEASSAGVRPILAAGLVAIAMLGVNAVSRAAAQSSHRVLASMLSIMVLAVDSTATVAIVAQLDLLDEQVVWALLVIPVLEGALLFRMRGALLTWIGVSLAYVALELTMPASFADPQTQSAFLDQLQTLLYRSGIVLLVAVPGGYLSEQLIHAIAAQRAQHEVAARRSALLVEVVDAGRRLNNLSTDFRSTVVESAINFGFDVADCGELGVATGRTVGRSRDFVGQDIDPLELAVVSATAEQAIAIERVMIVGGPGEDSTVQDQLDASGLGVVVLCPIRGVNGGTELLTAATRSGVLPTSHEIECLELLAGQAGVAVDNDELVGRLHKVQGRLEHQANHDVLTGLPNRLLFQTRLAEAMEQLESGRHDELCLLFLDLDRFKEINDSLGHEAGDELLVAVAGRLRSATRKTDTVARLGGDEFIVLMPDASEAGGSRAAEHICDRLATPFRLGDQAVAISTSIGIVATTEPMEPGELLRRVDTAMYQAKERGRATWQVHNPQLDADSQNRVELGRDLRRSLADGGLTAAFQPIIGLRSERIETVEVLARWEHPVHGPIPPERFIEVAEQSGLIIELGAQMLEEGCRRGVELRDLGHPTAIAVNISPHQARRADFVDQVLSTLHRVGLDPRLLVLELTERVLVTDEVHATLAALRLEGVRISIDDFGQGHTSIGSLGRLPADTLKIDQHFVRDARLDPPRAAILRSMVRIGHDLGLTVAAEGVETVEDLKHLHALGCDAVQGYLLHRPMPFDALCAVIAGDGPSRPNTPLAELRVS